jgi:hypothetical protein
MALPGGGSGGNRVRMFLSGCFPSADEPAAQTLAGMNEKADSADGFPGKEVYEDAELSEHFVTLEKKKQVLSRELDHLTGLHADAANARQ